MGRRYLLDKARWGMAEVPTRQTEMGDGVGTYSTNRDGGWRTGGGGSKGMRPLYAAAPACWRGLRSAGGAGLFFANSKASPNYLRLAFRLPA
jgi:hypothetical protein